MLCVSCDTFHPPLVVGKENYYLLHNSIIDYLGFTSSLLLPSNRLKMKFVQMSVIVGSFCTTYETSVTLILSVDTNKWLHGKLYSVCLTLFALRIFTTSVQPQKLPKTSKTSATNLQLVGWVCSKTVKAKETVPDFFPPVLNQIPVYTGCSLDETCWRLFTGQHAW